MAVGFSSVKRGEGRAFGLGLRRALPAVLGAALALAGCGASSSSGSARSRDPGVDAILVGTIAKPALTVEGLAVKVKTASYDVLITVSGPVVPGEGLPAPQSATTCTWTVTMSHSTGLVPVSLSDFHSVDHLGAVYLMGLVPGERQPPPTLLPGHSLTFRLRAYELVGEGLMQWAPDHRHVVAEWDYEVEND